VRLFRADQVALDPFGAMIVPPVRRRLRRPANDYIGLVTLVEGVPVLCVPGIIQCLHQSMFCSLAISLSSLYSTSVLAYVNARGPCHLTDCASSLKASSNFMLSLYSAVA